MVQVHQGKKQPVAEDQLRLAPGAGRPAAFPTSGFAKSGLPRGLPRGGEFGEQLAEVCAGDTGQGRMGAGRAGPGQLHNSPNPHGPCYGTTKSAGTSLRAATASHGLDQSRPPLRARISPNTRPVLPATHDPSLLDGPERGPAEHAELVMRHLDFGDHLAAVSHDPQHPNRPAPGYSLFTATKFLLPTMRSALTGHSTTTSSATKSATPDQSRAWIRSHNASITPEGSMGAPLHEPLTPRPWEPRGDLAHRPSSSRPLSAANRSQCR